MSTTIDSLVLETKSNAQSAVSGIDALSASLGRLKTAVKGGVGLTSVTNQLKNLNTALGGVDASSAGKLDALASSLQKLHGLGSIKISSSIATQLTSIGTAVRSLNGTDFGALTRFTNAIQPLANIGSLNLNSTISQLNKLPGDIGALNGVDMGSAAQKVRELVNALIPLTAIGNANLGSFFSQINRLPQMIATLNSINMQALTNQIRQLAAALAPLATQMNAIARGFPAFPARIQQLIRNTNNLSGANNRAANSYINLWAKCRMAMNVMKGAAVAISKWITESNKYIENLNLFTASMGKYAGEARKYAEQVGELMGIDPGEWMRNQGVFMTITEGFGVASDRAYIMSKNLTQLGYDLSSFFNISFADAMQKLQSGISGELEPLRRLGYDLSQARLQQEAWNLGIDKSITKMTQAEKSQIRYYAIMTQVTKAQGDMARTLNSPANQWRVLNAQITQCARALGNIFIPALNAVLPYAIALAKVLRMIATEIANFFGFTLPEVDYSGLAEGADSIAGAVGDTEDGLEGATKAAKKLKNALIGIDELNIISQNEADDGNKLGDLLGGGDLGFELPEYDFLAGLVESRVDEIVKMITGALSEITAVVSGYLLAIGTILVVTGANIPVGLGLMAVGAIGLAAVIAENWNAMSDRLARVLTLITGILGGFLLAIGAFLVFSGVDVPLGAALMVAGAVALATAVTINWKFLQGELKNALSILTAIVSGALLAMGALFAFTGADVPLGIALMAAGAIGLVTAAALNWDFLTAPMKKAIGVLEAIVGGALLAMGALLALTGVNVPLGIAMIAAGAISIIAAVALNWDSITGDLKGALATIVAIVSGALIGVGAILALTGVNVSLGVAMIAAGAVGIVATASLNWGAITGKVSEVLKEIGIAVGAALLAVGAVLAFTGVALPLGVALMAAGAVSLVTGVALNWNSIVEKIKGVLKEIGIVAGAAMLALGVILCLTGVAIPLGVALIAAGAGSLASGVALNWDEIQSKVKQGLDCIAEKFGTFKDDVKKKLDEAGEAIGGWWSGVVEFWTKGEDGMNGFDHFKTFGQNIVEGFMKGVTEFFSDPLGWIGEHIVDPFVQGFKDLFGIHSPSTVMAEIGRYVAEGLLNGILEPFKAIGKWVKEHIVNPLKQAIANTPIGEFVVNIKNTASEWWNNTKSWWADVSKNGLSAKALVTLAKDRWDTVKKWIGEIPTLPQFISLAKEKWETVTGWIGNIPVVKQYVALAKEKWENVTKWVGNIPVVKQYVALAKERWNTVRDWIGYIPTLPQYIKLLKERWTTVKQWIGAIPVLEQGIKLVKHLWKSVRDWIGNIPVLDQAIQLTKHLWTTVKNWVGNIPILNQAIQLVKSGWSTVRTWIGNIPTLDQAIQLVKSGWTTVRTWIGNIPTLDQAIQLVKSGWTTVKNWVGYIPTLDQAIQLIKSGWSTVSNWIGNIPVLSQAISLAKSGWSTVASWIGRIPALEQAISLAKSGWTSIAGFVGTSVSVGVSLFKQGWNSLSSWVGNKISVGVELFKSGWNSIKSFFGLSTGGYNTGHGWKFFEKGGYIDNGQAQFWKNIPMYKNGTTNAGLHGSMFVAGENGAEMVGHINGQTEVLNRSQISMAMENAVVKGMAQYTGYWRSLNSQMTVCANGVIRSILVSSDVLSANLVNASSYDPTNALAQMVYEDSQRAYDKAASGDMMGRSMRDFYREYVEPTLKEIAADTKRQADKEETTVVQIGNRTITEAVDTQKKANGYVFAK